MPRKSESRGTCAYCGETITRRSVPFDKLPELVALSERRSGRDVKSAWTANTAKGREGREGVRAFRDVSRFSRSNVLRSEMNHDPTNLAERI